MERLQPEPPRTCSRWYNDRLEFLTLFDLEQLCRETYENSCHVKVTGADSISVEDLRVLKKKIQKQGFAIELNLISTIS